MFFKRLRIKFSAIKIKKLVELSVYDAKKILNKTHIKKLKEIETQHEQDIALLKIRYENQIRVMQLELDGIQTDKNNFQQSHYKTQGISDNLKGSIISLGTMIDDNFNYTILEHQRFKKSFDSAIKTFKDLAEITLIDNMVPTINNKKI